MKYLFLFILVAGLAAIIAGYGCEDNKRNPPTITFTVQSIEYVRIGHAPSIFGGRPDEIVRVLHTDKGDCLASSNFYIEGHTYEVEWFGFMNELPHISKFIREVK